MEEFRPLLRLAQWLQTPVRGRLRIFLLSVHRWPPRRHFHARYVFSDHFRPALPRPHPQSLPSQRLTIDPRAMHIDKSIVQPSYETYCNSRAQSQPLHAALHHKRKKCGHNHRRYFLPVRLGIIRCPRPVSYLSIELIGFDRNLFQSPPPRPV